MLCGPGTYSTGGGGVKLCIQCPAGSYGSTTGLKSSACSGPCPAGRVCQPGTVNPTVLCHPGTYSVAGASSCTACPLGTPYSPAGANSSAMCTNCVGACGDGQQGKILSTTIPACSNSLASWTLWIDRMVSRDLVVSISRWCTGRQHCHSAQLPQSCAAQLSLELNAMCCTYVGFLVTVCGLAACQGVETKHSCLKYVGVALPVSWALASSGCSSLALGAHLLTTAQVCTAPRHILVSCCRSRGRGAMAHGHDEYAARWRRSSSWAWDLPL